MTQQPTALIIAFVDAPDRAVRLRRYAEQAVSGGAFLIAADSGGQTSLGWGLMPAILVGDMDSIAPESLATLKANPTVQIIQRPAEKDETDLELALYTALETGFRDITILGGLGGRLDHTLGNLYLLAAPRLTELGATVRLLAEDQEIFLLRDGATLTLAGQPGDTLSLIPFSSLAKGIRTEGLYYPLRGESLYLGPGRGISNVFTGPEATISLEEGLLLVIHLFSS